jgi:hypothetical protein
MDFGLVAAPTNNRVSLGAGICLDAIMTNDPQSINFAWCHRRDNGSDISRRYALKPTLDCEMPIARRCAARSGATECCKPEQAKCQYALHGPNEKWAELFGN